MGLDNEKGALLEIKLLKVEGGGGRGRGSLKLKRAAFVGRRVRNRILY